MALAVGVMESGSAAPSALVSPIILADSWIGLRVVGRTGRTEIEPVMLLRVYVHFGEHRARSLGRSPSYSVVRSCPAPLRFPGRSVWSGKVFGKTLTRLGRRNSSTPPLPLTHVKLSTNCASGVRLQELQETGRQYRPEISSQLRGSEGGNKRVLQSLVEPEHII